METVNTSETSVNIYQPTRRNIPEDSHLQYLNGSERGYDDCKWTLLYQAMIKWRVLLHQARVKWRVLLHQARVKWRVLLHQARVKW
jgi:hypothetical protein